jgi:hypothetical protein
VLHLLIVSHDSCDANANGWAKDPAQLSAAFQTCSACAQIPSILLEMWPQLALKGSVRPCHDVAPVAQEMCPWLSIGFYSTGHSRLNRVGVVLALTAIVSLPETAYVYKFMCSYALL